MRPAGYTLIELLVVISIISILAVVGFVNFKGLSQDQVTNKAGRDLQTLLRLAQSNATSSTLCNGQAALQWYVVITSASNFDLRCDTAATVNAYSRSYPLESGAEIQTIRGSGCGDSPLSRNQFTVKYLSNLGTFSFSVAGTPTQTCLESNTLTFTLRNPRSNTTKSFTINKGGAIDVQ